MTPVQFSDVMRRMMQRIFPGLKGYAWPILGKVVKVHTGAGKADATEPRYCVDVRPLLRDGSSDDEAPIIEKAELSPIWAGDDTGIYALPSEGALVRVAFYYWDPSQPYVDAVLSRGYSVPAHPVDQLLIARGGQSIVVDDSKVSIEAAGVNITVEAGQVTITGGMIRLGDQADSPAVRFTELLAWLNTHTHLVQALPSAPPVPPVPTLVPTIPCPPAIASQKVTLK